jgi:hypothetical protein
VRDFILSPRGEGRKLFYGNLTALQEMESKRRDCQLTRQSIEHQVGYDRVIKRGFPMSRPDPKSPIKEVHMKKFIAIPIIVSLAIIFVPGAFSKEIKTETTDKLGIGPNIIFLCAGPFLDKKYTRFRVAFSNMEIYTIVILEKVIPETEGQEGRILWTRILKFDEDNKFISPKDFMSSFKWISPTSFSFVNFKQKYIVEGLDKDMPILKEVSK